MIAPGRHEALIELKNLIHDHKFTEALLWLDNNDHDIQDVEKSSLKGLVYIFLSGNYHISHSIL
jgi:hypothetical protein